MAHITIKLNDAEKATMIKAIKKSKGKTISVAKLAEIAEQNPNRARFVIEELIAEGKVEKVATKQFNDRYIRYTYVAK